jgi:hypothetical protein
MSGISSDGQADSLVCPECAGPLAAGDVEGKGKGADWQWLSCPACRRSFKWRPTRGGIIARVIFIVVGVVYLATVPVHDTFSLICEVTSVALIVWSLVTLILMWRTAAAWKGRRTA